MADRHEGHERSADEIRREIERTRSDLDRTVDALGDKLSPGRIVDDLYARLRADGGSALSDAVKHHPLPFTLMGLGLGWLAWEQARGNGNGHVGEGTYGRAEGRVGPYRGDDAVNRDDPDWEYASTATKMKAKVAGAAHAVADAAHTVAEKASDAGHAVQDTAASARDKAAAVREKMEETAASARDRMGAAREKMSGAREALAEKSKDGFFSLLEQNPMALGAIAFGIGLASGISVPSSGWEDERIGPAAGRVKDEIGRTAREAAEKVKIVALDAYEAGRQEFDRQREEIANPLRMLADKAEGSAKQVVSAAADAARERARSEDLTPEGMKAMARRARDRAVEKAPSDG